MKPLEEAVDALAAFGFSPRQARFLALVMRHTGLCLPRQYAAFAGTSYGRKVNDFFTRLVDDGWASSWPCVHNRARLYHVHHKALYRAIGDADSRFRRAISARAVTGRIERLDALLTAPSTNWFATFEELAEALAAVTGDRDAELLDLARRATATRGDQGPVLGIDETRRLVLLYVMTGGWTGDCGVLVRPAFPLLRCLPRWSIQLALTAAQTALLPEFVRAVITALAPVPDAVLTDLRWYFRERQRGPAADRDRATAERLAAARLTYQDALYEALFRAWLAMSESLFEELSSTVLQEAYASFHGRVQAHVMPRTYRHLDPLLEPRRSRRLGVEEGAHRVPTPLMHSQPPPQPRARSKVAASPTSRTAQMRHVCVWRSVVYESEVPARSRGDRGPNNRRCSLQGESRGCERPATLARGLPNGSLTPCLSVPGARGEAVMESCTDRA